MSDIAVEIGRLTGELRGRRYPTLVIALDDSSTVDSEVLRSAAEKNGLRPVGYRTEVLKADGSPVHLGAYLRSEFRDWLKSEARKHGGILVYDADELISSWSDSERKAFFMDFLYLESNMPDGVARAPIVLASYHASHYALPTEHSGQGIVWTPEHS